MPKIVNRRDLTIPKVYDSGKNKKGGYFPAHQTIATTSLPHWVKIPITPSAPTNAFSNGATINFDIEPFDVHEMNDVEIKLTLSASGGNVSLVPSFWLMDKIILESDRGSGVEISRIYPETILSWCVMTMKEDMLRQYPKLGNFHLTEYKYSNQNKITIGDDTTLYDGQTREIYIPIPLNFIKMAALDMSHISTPLRLRFECSNDVVVSGDVANLSLDNIELVVNSRTDEPFDVQHRKNTHLRNNKYVYLEAERLTYNDKSIQPNVEVKYDLQSFVANSPFLVIVVKGSTSPQASDETLYDFLELGDAATIDLQNTSGQSEISASQNEVDIKRLEKYYFENIGTKTIQGMYVLPFCEDVSKALAGNMNGFYSFTGNKMYLCITPDSNGTAEVHNVDLGVTSCDSGAYCFYVDGELSDSLLYNASTTDMKNALESIPKVSERGYTCTIDNDTTNGSFNITWDANRDGGVANELGVVRVVSQNLADGSDPAVPTSSVTTRGKKGWSGSSDRQIEIYCYKYQELCIDKQGRFSVRKI